MAPADAGDFLLDQDDDDFFGQYNPHPYQGGYDLATTFGTPLPPSANICYPVSSAAAAAAAAAAPITPSPSPPTPTPEPADPPPVEPNGDEKAPREPVRESPEVFPNGAAKERKVRKGGWSRHGFLKKCVRGLDYIFGYKDPYAEQRIGVDSYVVPVYANRKESGDDALAVEVEVPSPSVGRVEPHDGSEELVQSNALLSYNVEHMTSGQPIHCYHHHRCKQPLNVQVEPPEPVSSQRLEYYEHFPTYCDQSGAHILETPAHAYNIRSYTPISDVPLEPFRPSWSQNWGLYDAYMHGDALENDTHSLISGEYGGIGSLFISPFYPRETETFEQAPSDEHASFQHNWHNLSYRNMPMDDFSLITHPDDDSYSVNGSFWPFGGHSAYGV